MLALDLASVIQGNSKLPCSGVIDTLECDELCCSQLERQRTKDNEVEMKDLDGLKNGDIGRHDSKEK